MGRFLVLANRTLTGSELQHALLDRAAADPGATFHLILPSGRVDDGHALADSEHLRFEGEAQKVTAERLRLKTAVDRLTAAGLTVTCDIIDASPLKAARSALETGEYDEVIVSTLPRGPSAWLKMDLPTRLRRQVDVPVAHVEAVTSPAR